MLANIRPSSQIFAYNARSSPINGLPCHISTFAGHYGHFAGPSVLRYLHQRLHFAFSVYLPQLPLISLLFMSSVVFPLFLPEGVNINGLIRAQVAIILFTAAYIAEVVRGGLQAIPRGQYEAAESLGLNFYLTMRLIVLPQALKIVIPPSVSILISAFKDTSLVVIIALFDFLKTTKTALNDPQWMGFSAEAYIFAALIYFLCCFFMSNYSRRLERELETGL